MARSPEHGPGRHAAPCRRRADADRPDRSPQAPPAGAHRRRARLGCAEDRGLPGRVRRSAARFATDTASDPETPGCARDPAPRSRRPPMKMRPECGPLQPGDQAQQCGLAAAARPQQRHEFAGPDGKIDRIEHRQRLAMKIELMADLSPAGPARRARAAAATIAADPSARTAADRAGGTAA